MAHLPFLDDLRLCQRYDRGHVAASLEQLPLQISHALRHARVSFPAAARRCHTLLAIGMGGSGLGADLVRGLLADVLPRPLISLRSPELPAAARSGTLVLLTSYSGTTAETIAAAKEAHRRRLPLAVITAGGELASLAQRWRAPCYRIDTKANPSGQPRLGVGFLATALLVMLDRLGWWRFTPSLHQGVLQTVRQTWRLVSPGVPQRRNPLKQLAVQLQNRLVLTIASDRYYGNAHILANQINENAKAFAVAFALPELNHHLLEGLRFPRAMRAAAGVTLGGRGDEGLRRRFSLTADVFRQNHLPVFDLRPQGNLPLTQAYSFLTQSGLLSYYLALLHRVDPSVIPWVDYFKRALARPATPGERRRSRRL